MKEKDINTWMIEHKFAKNEFNAWAIFKGLNLYNVPRFWARVKLILIYRKWRDAGEPSKVAFENALSGMVPQELLSKLGIDFCGRI